MAVIWVLIMIIVDLAASQYYIQHQAPAAAVLTDSCIERAMQQWYVPAATRFTQFAPFTLSMPSNRHLYENLFTQSFTPQTFKEYCRNYHTGRREYERCPPTIQKTNALAGYGLADYICIQRLEEFANALPCLQSAITVSMATCAQQCSQFEPSSRMHLQPQPGVDPRVHMAGDCRYLRCLLDCRRPQVAVRCGQSPANMVHEALQTTMLSIRKQQDPSMMMVSGAQVGNMFGGMFPQECLALINYAPGFSGISDPNPILLPFPQPNPFPINPNPLQPVINPNTNPLINSNTFPDSNTYPYYERGSAARKSFSLSVICLLVISLIVRQSMVSL